MVLKLIRSMLTAGVALPDGVVVTTTEGTPQGGPLSPLLSNIVLDELDWELERRGLKFVRYADDCNIYVGSERAAHRVMAGVCCSFHRESPAAQGEREQVALVVLVRRRTSQRTAAGCGGVTAGV